MPAPFHSRSVAAFCTGVAVALQEIDLLPPETRSSQAVLETLDKFLRDTTLRGRDRRELDMILENLHEAMKTPLVAHPDPDLQKLN